MVVSLLSSSTAKQAQTENKDLRKRFRILLEEGRKLESTSLRININQVPNYFDQNRFLEAQQTCNKYYSNITLGSTVGLLILVQLECILLPLLKTGRSRTVADLYDRYTATKRSILHCYQTNFYDPKSEGWKCINLVRSMHQKIHKLMNDGRNETEGGYLWVNQYDMCITQFAFIGFFLLHPKQCGAYHISKAELASIAYYWRIMSYYFGIEERFNLFSVCDNFEDQLDYLDIILEHIKHQLAIKRPQVGVEMSKGIMLAFEDFSTFLSFNILDHDWAHVISLSGLRRPETYSLLDRWRIISYYIIVKFLYRFNALLQFFNRQYLVKFEKFCASRTEIKRKLDRKYKHLKYELERDIQTGSS